MTSQWPHSKQSTAANSQQLTNKHWPTTDQWNHLTTYADISNGSTTWRVFTNHSRVWCRCELRRRMTGRDHRDSDRYHSDVLLHSRVLAGYQLLTLTSHSPHITNTSLTAINSVTMVCLIELLYCKLDVYWAVCTQLSTLSVVSLSFTH